MMDLAEFRDRLDALGADLAAWPADERAAAGTLVATSAEAREALAAARRLDTRLFQAMGGAASATLRARIAAIPATHPGAAGRRPQLGAWFARPWRIGMAAAAASLVLGLAVGRSDLIPLDESNTAYDAATLPYDVAGLMETTP
jgi:hypothetical protein